MSMKAVVVLVLCLIAFGGIALANINHARKKKEAGTGDAE